MWEGGQQYKDKIMPTNIRLARKSPYIQNGEPVKTVVKFTTDKEKVEDSITYIYNDPNQVTSINYLALVANNFALAGTNTVGQQPQDKIQEIDKPFPKYDELGYEYTYYAEEPDVPSGFEWVEKDKKDSLTVTNRKSTTKPSNPTGPSSGRVDGDDRIETAINISEKYHDKADVVIVVRHDLFPDSMTSSVLAKLKDAPILLNPTVKLDPRVGAEIKRLGAKEIIIVGGESSISEKVREELKTYDVDKNVERIAGHDRYGTSEMVARRVVGITGKKNIGVVASGEVFPDALSVGTFASREGYPILLVKKNAVPLQIAKAVKDLSINKTYIAGGVGTISGVTEAKLPGVIERMSGKTRYDTALAIARSKFANSKEAFIASGEEFADALVISPISGKYNRPILLVSSKRS